MKMKFFLSILTMSVTFMFFSASVSYADHHVDKKTSLQAGPSQEKCPVRGGPVDKKVYADHKGKRIYFCCEDCVKSFKADPDKFIKKMESEGVKLEDTPKK